MPGMGSGLGLNNPTIVSAFRSLLEHQALFILLLLALLVVGWNVLRAIQLRRRLSGELQSEPSPNPEPEARRLIRISFGFLWIFDGILQAQASMPLGMTTQTIQPSAAASPSWVQHLVNVGGNDLEQSPRHRSGLGCLDPGRSRDLAARGSPRQLVTFGGVSSALWGLIVWVFGESFGGIFAPGLSWAFGAPGAVVFYCVAGILVALADRAWTTPRLGRGILSATGVFFVGMAVLQAWPGRGFWQGQLHKSQPPGTLTAMVQQMAQTPQPRSVVACGFRASALLMPRTGGR